MGIKEILCQKKPREVSGSRTLNAYSYQIDICAYLVLEMLRSEDDFLTLVDYLDDIVILDNKDNPQKITFYQIKTSANEISMTTILNDEWFNKMEENLDSFKTCNARSILLTNTDIICYKKKFKTIVDKYIVNAEYDNEKTLKECFQNSDDGKKIEYLIKTYVKQESFDKISILKSKFTLADHDNQLLGELTSFISEFDPRLDAAALKCVYNEFVVTLKNLSKNVYLPQEILFNELVTIKGFGRSNFIDICNKTKKMMIPLEFEKIYKFAVETLHYSFKQNIIHLRDKYREFSIKASHFREVYDRITSILDKIDLSNLENEELLLTCKNILDNNKDVSVMDFYNQYSEFIIIVYLYKC